MLSSTPHTPIMFQLQVQPSELCNISLFFKCMLFLKLTDYFLCIVLPVTQLSHCVNVLYVICLIVPVPVLSAVSD